MTRFGLKIVQISTELAGNGPDRAALGYSEVIDVNNVLQRWLYATKQISPIAIMARLDRLGPDVDTILTNSQSGREISAQGDGSTAQIGETAFISRDALSAVIERDEFGNEIMYRTMTEEDFYYLERTGRVPSTSETSISPVFSYSSENYRGVTVRLVTEPGTSFELQQIGVSANDATRLVFPDMPQSQAGEWAEDHAQFKVEKGQMTTQLGQGEALNIFNNNLVSFELVD